MAHFFALPPEVREMIYKYCLLVEEIRPYQDAEHRYLKGTGRTEYLELNGMEGMNEVIPSSDRPSTALIMVCKLIREEAEPMLYSRNTFVLPIFRFSARFFSHSLNTKERKSWLKYVELELTQLDMETQERKQLFGEEVAYLEPFFTNPSETYYKTNQREHAVWDFIVELDLEYQKTLIRNHWPAKLAPILDDLELKELYVDVRGNTCTDTCCEMGGCALEAFKKGFANGLPDNLIITGCLKEDDEVERLISEWSQEREKRRHLLNEGLYHSGKLGEECMQVCHFDGSKEWAEKRQRRRDELSEAQHQVAELSEECMEEYSPEGTWGNFGVWALEDC